MELQALYDLANEQNIELVQYPMAKSGSMSVMALDGSCYIGMDNSVQDGGSKERVHLSHEIRHCVTGSFYNIYAPLDIRQKHENRADKWAIEKLIPADSLEAAVKKGYTEIWELAEFFDVTYDFMQKAVCYYNYGTLSVSSYF